MTTDDASGSSFSLLYGLTSLTEKDEGVKIDKGPEIQNWNQTSRNDGNRGVIRREYPRNPTPRGIKIKRYLD